jgi:hypothetical protein
LTGIRNRIVSGGFINDPIGLMRDLSKTITTNVPRKLLPDLADAMTRIGRTDTYRNVMGSPMVSSDYDARGYILVPNLERITTLAKSMFPTSGELPAKKYRVGEGSGGKATTSGIGGCGSAPPARPRATPKPTPKPTKKPTPKPTATPTPTPEATPEPTPEATPEPTPTSSPEPPPSPETTP